jgi:flagellar hook-associated protein 3 FlgL
MTAFRITQRSIAARTTSNLQYSLRRMATTQDQLSSGRQISRPSDNPVGTVSALRFRADIRQAEQYVRNADDGLGWLGNADQTLTSSLNFTRRARELSVQAVNGANGEKERRALAVEILALRDSLIGLANTQHLGRPIFGGTAADMKPYDTDGSFQVTGAAATGIVERTVAPGERIQVNMTGPEVFGNEPDNLFNVLTRIADDLLANDVSNMSTNLTDLDARTGNIIDALGEIGARFNRVETMRERATDQILDLRNSLSEVEDIDLPATIMDMQLQETAYKAALSATARVLQPSLVDFLR